MPKPDVRRHTPLIVIVVLVTAPLAIWAATSGGSSGGDREGLIVERGVSITGDPELILSIAADVQVTGGGSSVTVECMDKDGKVIMNATHPWPFLDETGYPYPHVHQGDSPEKVEGVRRCRVLGTETRLEAEVQ